MTSHSTAEVARIADGLTKAQKRVVLAAVQGPREKQPWINLGMTTRPTVSALNRVGIVDYYEAPARLTPLGLAVRTHLEAKL